MGTPTNKPTRGRCRQGPPRRQTPHTPLSGARARHGRGGGGGRRRRAVDPSDVVAAAPATDGAAAAGGGGRRRRWEVYPATLSRRPPPMDGHRQPLKGAAARGLQSAATLHCRRTHRRPPPHHRWRAAPSCGQCSATSRRQWHGKRGRTAAQVTSLSAVVTARSFPHTRSWGALQRWGPRRPCAARRLGRPTAAHGAQHSAWAPARRVGPSAALRSSTSSVEGP